ELREETSLGRALGQEIRVNDEGSSAVRDLLARFFSQEAVPIVTAEELARRMAHLARLMDRAITATFEQEKTSGPFHAQYRAFQEALIPSLTPAEFADMYAQTLTYGLFAARVQQLDSGGKLTRDTIYKYLPSTNPFLTDFFQQISGPNMPDAVSWLVDDLAYILQRADMHEILRQFGQRTRQEDPIIHFYETFLREYDPKLRQNQGIYYTPEPVVSYIVRLLDYILQTHFDRPLGLADPNTLILDPATLFRQLAQFGYELTQLHLMTHPSLDQLVTSFPQSGSNEVTKGHPRYVEPTPMGHPGRVFINKTQFFEGIDPDVWEFQIGGYQPLDKWLKDRRGRKLSFDDIIHYQRIVVALQHTQRLMTAIDNAIPGWPLDETTDDDDPHPDGGNDSIPPEPILPDADTPLGELKLFSIRVQNALLRRGIVTLRLLLMHTPELLQQNTKHLGERGLAEIEATLKQWGWAMPNQANGEQVVLIRLITAALRKEPRPLPLPALTKKVNFFDQSKPKMSWSEVAVAVGAAQHPYVEALENGTYQFNIQPIDTPITLPTPSGDEESSDIKDAPCQNKLDSSVVWIENRDGFSGNKSHLDFDLIKEFELLPKRATNALVRAGICTPRLLLMHTADLLMQEVKNLGPTSLAEIESGLASWGWKLAESAHAEHVTLIRLLTAATYNASHPLNLSTIAQRVNQGHAHFAWDEAEIVQAAAVHPYLIEVEDGRYQFIIRPVDTLPSAPASTQPPDASSASQQEPETIKLDTLWSNWLAGLDEKEREVLFLRYGVHGEEPMTLSEVGEALAEQVSRERIRQIEKKGLTRLGNQQHQSYWRPLRQLLAQGIQDAGGLLAIDQWERILDENEVWEADEPRPQLLSLLCAVLDDYHFLNQINAVTVSHIKYGHITQLDGTLKKILRQHKQNGLSTDELIQEAQRRLSTDAPLDVQEPAFIIRATDFFERVGPGKNGRYFYLKKKKKPLYPVADSGWAGKPGTQLHEWESKLRQQFEKVAWLGQLPLTEDDFKTLCRIIQEEAQAPNVQTKVVEGQPRLVPPAVFLTTMTLSARYAEQKPDEAVDEFWNPYLRAVWGVSYSQAFMARCRKRFISVLPYLEKTFGFVFPQQTAGDLVTPVFRHALLPRYMQADFADWLRKNWRHVLAVADTPELLASHLQQERSLDLYYSHRLKQFITSKATAETAAVLVANMAAAISLHVNDGETIESISDLLADTPIEQEVWRELAQVFLETQQSQTGSLRQTKPRLSWVWSLDAEEIALRVQNIILP
ncbi:MAG: N-6 DNA methylase, partial [Anaerolineales bacterium]|nr:N-6 DNA methylase [Anaerolineales bacterium]